MGLFNKIKEKMTEPTPKNPMYDGAMVLLYNLDREKGLQFEIMCENLGVKVIYEAEDDYLKPVALWLKSPAWSA